MIPFGVPESFVSGGVFLIIFGAVVAYFRRLPAQIWGIMERHLFVSLHVFDNDESFHWIKIWMGEKLKNTKSKSIFTRRIENNAELPYADSADNNESQYKKILDFNGKDRRPQAAFIPAPNVYFFTFKGKLCWVNYERKESEGQAGLQKPRESFVIRCMTRRNSFLEEMVEEARNTALPMDDRIEIRVANHYSWELFGRVNSRPIDSVILPDQIPEKIIKDIRNFQQSKDWYSKLGIPHRRGFLLYGPPGGGKSSLVLAVASELGLNIHVLFLSNPNISDATLQELINKVDSNSVILIEDIDSIFKKRKKTGGSKVQNLSFSGLLNAIDGLASQGGRILFMTTNKIHELDPALIRPGRADVRIYFPHASRDQIRTLFSRFYPLISDEVAERFANSIPNNEVSMASIQGHLLKNRDNPESAIETVFEMIKEEKRVIEARKSKEEE